MAFWNRAKNPSTIPLPPAGAMQTATARWEALFCGRAPGEAGLHLAAGIAGEMARLVTVEAACHLAGSARAAFLAAHLAPTMQRLRGTAEHALALGGVVLKPCFDGDALRVDCVKAGRYWPTAWDAEGNITGMVFCQYLQSGRRAYVRAEHHRMAAAGYVVENTAWLLPGGGTFVHPAALLAPGGPGRAVPLASVPPWAALPPRIVLCRADGTRLEKPLFAHFKMPFANHVEEQSPLGVSVYSRAEKLLAAAEAQYARVLWEYEGSELAVDASVGALAPGAAVGEGPPALQLPKGGRRLFRQLALNGPGGEDLYRVFSPAIRDESLWRGLDKILKRVEFACYLSYGTLSDPQSVDKTAEEIKMARQRSYSAVCDIQRAAEGALRQLVWALDVYADLYALAPRGSYEISFNWGDSVTTDTERERAALRQDCLDGAAAWWEYRVRFYGETEAEAKRATAALAGGGSTGGVPPG